MFIYLFSYFLSIYTLSTLYYAFIHVYVFMFIYSFIFICIYLSIAT